MARKAKRERPTRGRILALENANRSLRGRIDELKDWNRDREAVLGEDVARLRARLEERDSRRPAELVLTVAGGIQISVTAGRDIPSTIQIVSQ